MGNVKDWRMWALAIGVLGGIAGLMAAGYFLGQWGMAAERQNWQIERKAYIDRFPVVRAQERNSCVKEYDARVAGMQRQIDDFGDIKAMVADSHEINAYTLRFLGKRAEISDARTAALLKQTKAATAVAVETKQSLEQVDKKLTEQNAKVNAAASAAQNIEKKLAPIPAPAQPSKGWFGFGGH